jgi:hypothetical protein
MQPIRKAHLPLAIAFALLFALNISGFDQTTAPNPGTATNPSASQPAQNPAGSYQTGIGTTTLNSIPAQPPNTANPGVTPNLNVTPNSTLPNQNPNLVPNPFPNTVPTTSYPNSNSTSIQPGIGTTTPNSIPAQPPNTTTPNSTVIFTPNPNFTPNSNVVPNSTLPNQNSNLVPNPYPTTVQTVPLPGTLSSPIGAGVPGASPPLSCSRVQAWQCLE